MSENDYNEMLRKRLIKYLEINNKTKTDLANYLGTNISTVSSWCSGARTPKMDSIDKMCKFFNISRSDMIGDSVCEDEGNYYFDAETREYANEIKNNSELKLLFDASRNAKKEDLQFVYNMLLELKKREQKDCE